MKEEVFEYISENEPLDQDKVEEMFGRRGLGCVKTLMENDRVSYTIEWNLQTQ